MEAKIEAQVPGPPAGTPVPAGQECGAAVEQEKLQASMAGKQKPSAKDKTEWPG